MENNIFSLLSSLMGQNNLMQNLGQNFNQNSNQNMAQNSGSNFGANSSQNNPSFSYYPKEAYQNFQAAENQSSNNQPNNMNDGILPLLAQMSGGKNDGLFNMLKGGDMSSLFSATSSKQSTKKEGTAPKDEIIL